MLTSDFDYNLPPELIAQKPAERRDLARLMVLDRRDESIKHRRFADLAEFLAPGDLLVINDTKVIPARLTGKRPTGARIEMTLIAPEGGSDKRWRCLAKPGRRLKPGEDVVVADNLKVAPISCDDGGVWTIELKTDLPAMDALEKYGRAPLPPYIRRSDSDDRSEDLSRYQTVYAKDWGAVAAPTAGLHFSDAALDAIRAKGVGVASVTLDVAWGSFAPVREDLVENHKVSPERFAVSERCAELVESTKASGGRVITVGTTSTRALESAVRDGKVAPMRGETNIFIAPGFKFQAVDAMITNFHLPKSSLLMLAAAFAGRETILKAYDVAVAEGYRFYSYGDAMLII